MARNAFFLFIALGLLAAPTQGKYGGGYGTREAPYLIYTAAQMDSIGANPGDWGKHFKLMGNIDLSSYPGRGFNIIGNGSGQPFTGTFDGNGKSISNFTYSRPWTDDVGIFGCVDTGGEIKDLHIKYPNVDGGERSRVGSLVGQLLDGTIVNCHVEGGRISGAGEYIGGLVGLNEGQVVNCSVEGANVLGYGQFTGGLVGRNGGGLTDCSAAATVSGPSDRIGGLVGENSSFGTVIGIISNCFAAGQVTGDDKVGGLVGFNDGEIRSSYAVAHISGESGVGGLVGINHEYGEGKGIVCECYSAGMVSGNTTVGGLVGLNEGEISYSFAIGSVMGTGDSAQHLGGLVGRSVGDKAEISNCYATADVAGAYWNVGGLVGQNDAAAIMHCYSTGSVSGSYRIGGLVGENINGGAISRSFWDRETSGLLYSAGGRSWMTVQMQTKSTFTSRGWDFVGESANGTEDIWTICHYGGNYPRLQWETPRVYHVDVFNGDDNNYGMTRTTAFATIQAAIEAAYGCDIVTVWPGVYAEKVDFLGKAITLTSAADAAVLEIPGHYAVWFHHGEEEGSVLKNFVIRNCHGAVYVYVASPTIRNVTVVSNTNGIVAEGGANPDIKNSIFWNNLNGDLYGCQARYSCIQKGYTGGVGNVSQDPLFADEANSDYHLLSERGRYRATTDEWILDNVSSPCIDSGDPAVNPAPERMPNGGRVNMGAYGGTAYGSMSEWPIAEDSNRDGVVNMIDLANVAEKWLQGFDWAR